MGLYWVHYEKYRVGLKVLRLRSLVSAGSVDSAIQCWRDTFRDWVADGRVRALFCLPAKHHRVTGA